MAEGEPCNAPLSLEAIRALIATATRRKEKGNGHFCRGRLLSKHTAGKQELMDACMEYAMGLNDLEKAKDSDAASLLQKEETQAWRALQLALFLNLAATNLLLEEWAPAKQCCDQVLRACVPEAAAAADAAEESAAVATAASSQPQAAAAAKAFYRRAQANRGAGDLTAARHDLRRAARLRPSDSGVRKELSAVELELEKRAAKEALDRETQAGRQRIQSSRADAAAALTAAAAGSIETEETTSSRSSSSGAAASSKIATAARRTGDPAAEAAAMAENGRSDEAGAGQPYVWAQNATEVRVHVPLPTDGGLQIDAKDLRVEISHSRIRVACLRSKVKEGPEAAIAASAGGCCSGKEPEVGSASGSGDLPGPATEPEMVLLLEGELEHAINASESLWMCDEHPGYVTLFLQKDQPLAAHSAGAAATAGQDAWWARALKGGKPVDVTAGRKEERRETAESYAAENSSLTESAGKDPFKAAAYRSLRERSPDVPITIK